MVPRLEHVAEFCFLLNSRGGLDIENQKQKNRNQRRKKETVLSPVCLSLLRFLGVKRKIKAKRANPNSRREMEENKQKGTASSFTSELFGSTKEFHHPSSAGIFGSIFSPSSSKTKVLGRESLRTEWSRKIANETWSSKIGIQDHHFSKDNGSETQNTVNKDMRSIYQDQRVQPCHLSSSIFYGGQDICPSPQGTRHEGLNSLLYQNDVGEDDSELASRGNWWQGSLYY
ncbi:unnamed protein product [Sphenostylis stenocarpa]|uniref:Uncharacterized protein n=1 Tax=Sphenostylis stenocarpa TaxID=92480 RepID=A0AA86VFS6_9FABA|nr:unnamed protein product [Sphenostylis stenocarpa]